MTWPTARFGALFAPAERALVGDQDLPLLSATGRDGLVNWSSRWGQRPPPQTLAHHRIVHEGELVLGINIDEGALGFQTLHPLAAVSPAYSVWRAKAPDEIHAPFIEHYLRSDQARRIFARWTPGAPRNRAPDKKALQALELPLPPLDAQRAIADVLERAETLLRQREETAALADVLIAAIFVEKFGDPMEPSPRWPRRPLLELAEIQRGRFSPRPRNDPAYFGGEHLFIQAGDIARNRGGRITTSGQTLNDVGAAVSHRFEPGTVVVATVGATLGETAIVARPLYAPDSVIGVTPRPGIATSEFLESLLRQARPRLLSLSPAAAMANLQQRTLRSLLVPAPPLAEQEAFSEAARAIENIKAAMARSEAELVSLRRALQHQAFAGDLKLAPLAPDAPFLPAPAPPPVEVAPDPRPRTDAAAFIAPPDVEPALERMDFKLEAGPGDSIPWSETYFRYRILSELAVAPFTFSQAWDQVYYDMPDAPYDEVKSALFSYLKAGHLRQVFDKALGQIVFEAVR